MKVALFLYLLAAVSGFDVYWNVPTQQCRRNYQIDFVNLLETYGIKVNEADNFQGNRITIFYESQLGLYPRVLRDGKMENGGIPQRGDLTKHLEAAAKDLQNLIPHESFNGLGVIDWEAWRPTWEFNWEPLRIYQTKSIELAKELNPLLKYNATAIAHIAEFQWENSSKNYMRETLQLAKKMRPKALWCYYLFPDCYNYNGKKPKDFECSEAIRNGNDKLSWLWEASTAICPSIYVHESHLDRYTFEERVWRDHQKIKEAIRVASHKNKIFPYVNYFDKDIIPAEDLWRMLAQAAASGTDGAVIWGASASVASYELCENLKEYVLKTLGPAAAKTSWNSNFCSKQVCNGHGRCTWLNDETGQAWKLFTNHNNGTFYAGDIVCRCFVGYSGRFCHDPDMQS